MPARVRAIATKWAVPCSESHRVAVVASAVLDQHPARWRVLGLLAIAELLGMSLWFAGSAVAGQLAQRWSIGPSQVAWITTTVQLGFVCGTALAAVLNLADVIPSRVFFACSAALGAVA